jgi:hypothetical protein
MMLNLKHGTGHLLAKRMAAALTAGMKQVLS